MGPGAGQGPVRTSAVAAVALWLAACAGGGEGTAGQGTAVPVGLGTVRRDTIGETLTLVGRLTPQPGGSALLSAPADAVVRAVPVQVGESVEAGRLLIELDAPELVTQAQSLRAAAEAAEADLARQRDLFQQGITARRQLEERVASATGARAAATAAERLLARARVTSPLAGGIQRVLVQPGERVSTGQPLVEVVNRSGLDLVASVSPANLARLAVGEPASVTAEAGGDPSPARVHAIAPGVDSLTGAGAVVIRIDGARSPLRPGGGATARVSLPVEHGALVVPDSALVLVGRTLTVFVVGSDSVAHARPVEVGTRSGGRTAVRGDLQPGDRVATTGAYGLVDGMRVVPVAGAE
jgi:RND family efflux transporter MFP subunit